MFWHVDLVLSSVSDSILKIYSDRDTFCCLIASPWLQWRCGVTRSEASDIVLSCICMAECAKRRWSAFMKTTATTLHALRRFVGLIRTVSFDCWAWTWWLRLPPPAMALCMCNQLGLDGDKYTYGTSFVRLRGRQDASHFSCRFAQNQVGDNESAHSTVIFVMWIQVKRNKEKEEVGKSYWKRVVLWFMHVTKNWSCGMIDKSDDFFIDRRLRAAIYGLSCSSEWLIRLIRVEANIYLAMLH